MVFMMLLKCIVNFKYCYITSNTPMFNPDDTYSIARSQWKKVDTSPG